MGIMDVIKGERIYLDTNIIIYAMEGYPEYVSSLASLFAAIDEGKLVAVTSELTLAESLVKPMMDDNVRLQNIYMEALQSSDALYIIPVNRQILIEAARLRAKSYTLNLPDAIHLATAHVHQCASFLTNDKRLRSLSEFYIVILSEA
ncbi:MAG: PIN domain-containing protein [Deltaproteobacteria bacterium]|nr:PIN domain-containing protein [Deltaproteobacteria bacterium]